ncbi:contact-dependent growth inhibition system immunity protein [Ralstonia sp. SET104]|uniref:contact-dependent growth inhibition system immunity protein n=1 Tax=Ralstonia sp. SET104 TaxID=2448774 RepID=UPI000F576E46|nr:contact-dependent growth inhibition system immunity protein [Ralstonia sp. SET104]GCB04858.1 hypothetical protein PSUB009319_24890 [Ralstonia sp. SET104]
MDESRYPELWQLIVCYFHEDYDLFGETMEEIVSSFNADADDDLRMEVVSQIDAFKIENDKNIDAAFVEIFGELGHIDMWGQKKVVPFLDELKRLLQK